MERSIDTYYSMTMENIQVIISYNMNYVFFFPYSVQVRSCTEKMQIRGWKDLTNYSTIKRTGKTLPTLQPEAL